jgi:hypothetical protein
LLSTDRGPVPYCGDVPAETDTLSLTRWSIPVLGYAADDALALLAWLADEKGEVEVGDDLRFWTLARLFALELLTRQQFTPVVDGQGLMPMAYWRPLLDEDPEARGFQQLAIAMPAACAAVSWSDGSPYFDREARLRAFLESAVDVLARRALQAWQPQASRSRLLQAWYDALRGDPDLAKLEEQERTLLASAWEEWARPPARSSEEATPFRVCLRLDPPAPPADGVERASAAPWSLSYLFQATDDPSLVVPAEEVWRQRGTAARFLGRRIANPQEHLLAGLGRAARIFPSLEPSLHTARPVACPLSPADTSAFLREAALVLRASGFGVLVPGLESRLGVRVRLGPPRPSAKTSQGIGGMGWDTVVSYDWEIALGDETLSREEFETLAALKQPLVEVRGKWVELRPEQVSAALALFAGQPERGEMTLTDAMRLVLAPEPADGLAAVKVETDRRLAELLEGSDRGKREGGLEPTDLVGRLRPYQSVGLSWLVGLRAHGLGACLADDMGLGKTIQLIALLLYARERESELPPAPSLLIAPTSVVGNWRHELARFAPSLRVLVHHGAERASDRFAEEAMCHDVVLSSYALLHRDRAALTSVAWNTVALDEAQNIKNASTQAAQVARQLPARWRVAMTGTPVENRLDELWSILHFLNPGYLGSAEEFRRRFANPIQRGRDATALARLKALVAPFILRRVKTDRSIIEDLPEKNESKLFCTLTREQATLYEAVVQEGLEQVEASDGIQRRGQVLAMLAKLKEICDHPALFLKDGSSLVGRSGKLARLTEMADEVLAADDRALIFTQYVRMGRLLQEHLAEQFGREVLFLHGGTAATARDRMVARFQQDEHGPPLFILSIKAGGTGLNLTRASHVFHFDRWWNPAVENQATDRAFRIGQLRNVHVHKFICAGSLEEALDELIERKQELSEAIVGTNEAWITEMTNAELRALLALRGDAVTEE